MFPQTKPCALTARGRQAFILRFILRFSADINYDPIKSVFTSSSSCDSIYLPFTLILPLEERMQLSVSPCFPHMYIFCLRLHVSSQHSAFDRICQAASPLKQRRPAAPLCVLAPVTSFRLVENFADLSSGHFNMKSGESVCEGKDGRSHALVTPPPRKSSPQINRISVIQ